MTVRGALCVTPLYVAWIFPVVTEETTLVVMVKLTLLEPAGIVTVAGTVAAEFVLTRETEVSNAAGPFSCTIPLTSWPPTTGLGKTQGLSKTRGVSRKACVKEPL